MLSKYSREWKNGVKRVGGGCGGWILQKVGVATCREEASRRKFNDLARK